MLYHENNRIGIYYAESWALLHMLKFDENYSPRFDRVLDAIGRGDSSERALETVYGKTIERIQGDLVAYVHGNHFRQGVINGKLDKHVAGPTPVPVDPVDVAVLLAGIEALGPHRQEAIQSLNELARDNPGKRTPIEALAWTDLAGSDPQAEVDSFRRALEAGTRDPNLCFQFAIRMRSAIPDAEYVTALKRAAEIDPGFSAAQQQLAAHAFNAHDYAEAVTRLHLVKKLDRKQAFKYYRALSFAAFQIGDVAEAKSAAARTQEFASNPDDKRLADEIIQYVNGAKPPAIAPGFFENPPPQQ
jgi:tetratricopeptide (TPR) repeat protein